MLSVIIPSYKDPLLQPTIDSLLLNARGEIEIIAVMDGYWGELKPDPRVRIVHLGKNRGMRGAINAGVRVARGEHIMRTDEHCIFSLGYDIELANTCEDNWIMTLLRYFLDPKEWKVMDIAPIECEKLVIQGGKKFSGKNWPERAKSTKAPILETMAMQGSMWFMHRKWWDEVIGELQTEGYGPMYQDSHEMVFKTWQAGGKLMMNRRAWYAHKHRSFSRTHQEGTKENPSKREASWQYALDIWGDYYKVIKAAWKI